MDSVQEETLAVSATEMIVDNEHNRPLLLRRRRRSHDSDSERLTKVVVSRKHTCYTHFPKDRNNEICKRTKITRGPRRKRIGEASRSQSPQ